MKMNTIWKAEVISPNFTFEAFGATESDATKALEDGWINHCKQYGLEVQPILNSIKPEMCALPLLLLASDEDWAWSVEPFKLNSCYRDDHLIKESE